MKALVAQLQVLLPSIAAFEVQIEALFESHPDAALFAALPGAGRHLAPRLLVAKEGFPAEGTGALELSQVSASDIG